MDAFMAILVFLLGLLLRLAIPIALTVLLVWLLRRLDARWQKEAEPRLAQAPAPNPGCWDIMRCPPERRAQCDAYAHPEMPCWQVYRQPDGLLRESCLNCRIFKQAPILTMS